MNIEQFIYEFTGKTDWKDIEELKFSVNEVMDIAEKFSNRLEKLVMPTAGSKPPLGVMPHIIWLEKRITELSRALYEYFTNGYYDDNTYKWLMELYNVYRQRDRYIEEQQKAKGCSA